MNRSEIIRTIEKDGDVDVLIIGAGVNGAATFLDLAINDVNVLLIDRGDFCSGASSTSSHMAHGGIRYLENGEFRLVREAVAERNRMIKNSPHLVKPLPTVIPIFKFWSGLLNAPLKFLNLLDRPAERGAFIIKIGLILYDSYTGKTRTVPKHQFFGKKDTFSHYPRLNKDVKYSAMYYDGQIFSPERLNTEIVLEGERSGKFAKALNYCEAIEFFDRRVTLLDKVNNEKVSVKPKILINAAGPWIDNVNSRFGIPSKYIGGTKGSHLIVDNPELRKAIGDNEIFFENKDGRIVLLFPYFDKVIIGTSDLPIDNPDTAVCSPEEEQYFIDLVKRVFPDIPVTPEQVIFRFSGVRPLEFQEKKTTGQITRDHSIKVDVVKNIPVLSLVGGKLTSFRAFGEQVADHVLSHIGKPRVVNTEEVRIGGGKGYPEDQNNKERLLESLANEKKTDRDTVSYLFDMYGMHVIEILDLAEDDLGVKKIAGFKRLTRNELVYLAREEKIVHLDDLILRRTSIGWLGGYTREQLREIAEIIAKELGWEKSTITEEIDRTIKILKEKHGVIL